MKSFFQSFSFLWNKKDFVTTLHKVKFSWIFPRFFVVALVAYILWTVVGFVFIQRVQFYDFTKENVSQDVRIIWSNVLDTLPKDVEFQMTSTGLRNNLSQDVHIPYSVFYSGTSFAWQVSWTNSTKTLALITALSTKEVDFMGQAFTLTPLFVTSFDGKKIQQYPLIQQWNAWTGENGKVTYDLLSELVVGAANGIVNNRDTMAHTLWIIVSVCVLIGVLLAALFVSLYAIAIAYAWSLLTWAIATIMKKWWNYQQSYKYTILAAFPLFIINRFVNIHPALDIVIVVLLVFVIDTFVISSNKLTHE